MQFKTGAKAQAKRMVTALGAVAALSALAPTSAFAAGYAATGTMTITMGASESGASAASAATKSASTLAQTGDVSVVFAALILALAAVAAVALLASRKFAANNGTHVASPTANRNAVIAVVLALVLATSLCFATFAGAAKAYAEGPDTQATSAVSVDENGKVLSSDLKITNTSDEDGGDIYIASVTAPSELDWEAEFSTEAVAKGESAECGWVGAESIPASVLDELKASSNKTLELNFEVIFSDSGVCRVEFYADIEDSSPYKVSYVPTDNKVESPASPTKEGYTFTKWYTDTALSQEYDFDEQVSSDLTLYAGWEEAADPTSTTHTITLYNAEWVLGTIQATEGVVVSQLDGLKQYENDLFLGWYTNSDCTTPLDSNYTMPNEDISLYADYQAV